MVDQDYGPVDALQRVSDFEVTDTRAVPAIYWFILSTDLDVFVFFDGCYSAIPLIDCR